ncbi:sporulation membrane protein YtaF [Alicyclobacillus cycloheptanicus]|uniref:Sporulation protein YtaF n=1 Tax=Alicyclobacillus cycloheptanicus TaxID=1457 RepID=A0ABT9XFX8_9BACL|nr:sporulation membrane protein YtaF [Alicyclobacillus cycloheptanicus]MDQ0188974.1 putative sporulation protein YtaF [Alicyclobacillus cycloheptanicus]
MHLVGFASIIAIGIASNLDNAGVGIAYGVRRIRIPWFPNLLIAVISFAATLLAGIFGHFINGWLPPQVGTWIGTLVIVAVGIWVLMQPFIARHPPKRKAKNGVITSILRNPESADRNRNLAISPGESLILGIALAMNALAGGFDAGITKLDVVWTSVSVGVFSYVLLGLAAFAGERYAAERLGEKATIAAGILLILVGIHQML